MISVVIPTYNCAQLMERHLESMEHWSDLAHEIIVVDSHSSDGTLEIIRSRLKHPNLRLIQRERGLYESWNEGIAATTGSWIYISTAGDTIERSHLLHLLSLGNQTMADVVISSPTFVDEQDLRCKDAKWPPSKIIHESKLNEPFVLTGEAAFVLSYLHSPKAILGSSASNLYRGDHLRARPFPVNFKGAGDSVWILQHARQSRLCFTPHIGSTFCIHPKIDDKVCSLEYLVSRIEVEKHEALIKAELSEHALKMLSAYNRIYEQSQSLFNKRRILNRTHPKKLRDVFFLLGINLAYLYIRCQVGIEREALFRKMLPARCFIPVKDLKITTP